jgi:hypothetical protein
MTILRPQTIGNVLPLLGAILLLALPSQVRAQPASKNPAGSKASTPKEPGAPKTSPLVTASQPFVATGCDDSLWSHVYRPQRLTRIQQCIEVTGTIHHTKKENDGDDHLQLKVDPQFSNLLNAKNTSVQAGCLVIEPICMGPVTQADAVIPCRDFHSPVKGVPPDGSKVKVLGSYVLDTEGGHGWTEIHPVTRISTM